MSKSARTAVWVLGGIAALIALYFLFEWAGTFLDTGGAVG